MSSQADVRSIEALKDFRTVLALYSEDTLAALGAVDAEVRRTARWLVEDRPHYWQDQIKRRRELVASARSEVFRRKLQKKPDYTPSMSEPMELLRKAEASLADAERRLTLVRKWQSTFNQAVLEFHGTTQRIKDLAATDVPRAVQSLIRIIDALEAYIQLAAPSGAVSLVAADSRTERTASDFESIAARVLDEDPPAGAPGAGPGSPGGLAGADASKEPASDSSAGTEGRDESDPSTRGA
jgi:hypothetical protein